MDPSPLSLPVLQEEIDALLTKRAVEPVREVSSPGFYSRLFLVKKKNGKMRPVIDLSSLNKFLIKEKFKMETLSSIKALVRQGDWGASIDLQDAYLHIPIHPSSRKYLRFSCQGKLFQFKCLPFGLASAPRVFTKVMETVAAYLRQRGLRVAQYFDDWLLLHAKQATLSHQLHVCWDTVISLGLIPNREKSDLNPSQDFVFVGTNFLTVPDKVRIPDDRAESLAASIQSFISQKSVRARPFLSLLGSLNAAAELIKMGRLHMRPLQFLLLDQWRPGVDPLSAPISLPDHVTPHLRWWFHTVSENQGVPRATQEPQLFLYTDASPYGWGAHLEPSGTMIKGEWSLEQRSLHINNLEMIAVHLALTQLVDQISGHCLLISSDNTTVVAYLSRQGGTRVRSLALLSWQILTWCQSREISLRVRHIAGKHNVLADNLSRFGRAVLSEWSLNKSVANTIFATWEFPSVDLFASRLNAKLPLFVSLFPDHRAWALDAFSFSWDRLVAYAFPPFNLLPQVLAKVRTSAVKLILVAPWWPQRAWFSDLIDLLIDQPRSLPPRKDLLSQHGGTLFHPNVPILHLHAYLLSADQSDRRRFQAESLRSSPELDDPRLTRCTNANGDSLQPGVLGAGLIQSIPL